MSENTKMKPTVDWMKKHYNILNSTLFDGKLGKCDFVVEAKRVKTLGWFRLTGQNLKYDRYRRLFKYDGNEKKYISDNSFYEMAKPCIGLNGYYSGTERVLLGTLVHEMCHYYTYMCGRVPRQGHGVEFRNIAFTVSNRSNGEYTIQRLATAEEMSEYELDDDVKQRVEKRQQSRFNGAMVILLYRTNGNVELTITKKISLLGEIIGIAERSYQPRGEVLKLCYTYDENAIKICLKYGLKSLQTTYRFYGFKQDSPIIKELETTDMNTRLEPAKAESLREIIENAIRNEIFSDTDSYDDGESNEVFDITPNMNLGKYSPIELLLK